MLRTTRSGCLSASDGKINSATAILCVTVCKSGILHRLPLRKARRNKGSFPGERCLRGYKGHEKRKAVPDSVVGEGQELENEEAEVQVSRFLLRPIQAQLSLGS